VAEPAPPPTGSDEWWENLFPHGAEAALFNYCDYNEPPEAFDDYYDVFHDTTLIVETTEVGVEHPVHLPARDPHGQRVRRVVQAPPGAESVAEPEEVLLV
jgi:hypothetical protein